MNYKIYFAVSILCANVCDVSGCLRCRCLVDLEADNVIVSYWEGRISDNLYSPTCSNNVQ